VRESIELPKPGCLAVERIAANLNLPGKQVLQTLVIHDQHDQDPRLRLQFADPSYLRSPKRTLERSSGGSAAGGDSSSMLSAKDKTAFDQVWLRRSCI
jgi:hypothetical protein